MELESIFEVLLRRHQQKYNLNSTDGHDILYKNFLYEDFEVSVLFLTIISVGIVSGIIGNIMIIGGVSAYKKLRTSGNVFIVNLAAADLIVLTIVQPFNMIGIIKGPQFFHGRLEALCHMVATVCVMSCACSMMSLAAVALNRYIFICKHLKYDSIYTKKKITAYIICIWVIVAFADLPNYMNWGAHTFDYQTMGCVFDRSFLPYTLFLSTLIYWIPLALVFACYISIYVYVRKNRIFFERQMAQLHETNAQLMSVRHEQDLRMIRTFVLVVVVFILCWVPYFALVLFDRDGDAPKIIYVLSLAIGHCNSSINSILYGATNKRFRTGYKLFLSKYVCYLCTRFSRGSGTKIKANIYTISNSSTIYAEKQGQITEKLSV